MPHRTFCLRDVRALAVPALLIGAAGSAFAITSDSFDYSRAKKGQATIAPTDVVPEDTTGGFSFSAGGASLATGSPACFNKGLDLPQGARLDTVEVWYRSIAFSTAPRVVIVVLELESGAVTELAKTALPDNTGARVSQTVAIDNHRVDNRRHAYGFTVCLISDDLFYGARIGYRYFDAGD